MRYRLLRGVVLLLKRIVLGSSLHVEGLEQVPRRGALLLVSNHVGTVDPPLTGALVPRHDLHYMAKVEHLRGWYGPVFRAFHAFAVVRESADRGALRHALALLEQGHAVLIYPEGSRSPDGTLQRAHPGAGFLARRSGAHIVPVAVWGSEHVIPRGRVIPRRTEVHVVFGRSFVLADGDEHGAPLTNHGAAALMLQRIAALLPAERRGSVTP